MGSFLFPIGGSLNPKSGLVLGLGTFIAQGKGSKKTFDLTLGFCYKLCFLSLFGGIRTGQELLAPGTIIGRSALGRAIN